MFYLDGGIRYQTRPILIYLVHDNLSRERSFLQIENSFQFYQLNHVEDCFILNCYTEV